MASLITELAWVVELDGDVIVLWDFWMLGEPKLLDLGFVCLEGLVLVVILGVCAAVFGVVAYSVAVGAELTSFLLWLTSFAVVLISIAKIVMIAVLGGVACSIAVVAVFLAAAWVASVKRIASTATNVISAAASTSV
jgi:hypothetical protein